VPPTSQDLFVDGPAGRLEARLELPSGDSAPPALAAVVCHPHPLFGGTLHNKVAHTLARTLCAGGVAALRFNFRGVGASEGTHDGGSGETADALAVASWLQARYPQAALVLAGFSFGGAIVIRAAAVLEPAWLFSVAPAVDRVDLAGLAVRCRDWLVVQGEADEVVSPAAVRDWAARHAPQARLRMLPGVGHFFHGALHTLQDVLREEWPASLTR
jgi:alpha/beta superfamily hydrolase